jgi:hypothetical protein
MSTEVLSELAIVLKAMGLDETTRGVQELDRVLKATGLTAEQLAKDLNRSEQAASQLHAGNVVLMKLFRDGDATIERYSTSLERLRATLMSVHQQMAVADNAGHPAFHRAVLDLESKIAVLEGRASTLSSRPLPNIDVPAGALENSAVSLKMRNEQLRQEAEAHNFVSSALVRRAAAEHRVAVEIKAAQEAARNAIPRIDVPAGALENSAIRLKMNQEGQRQAAEAASFVPLADVEHAAKVHKVETDINTAKATQIALLKDQSAETQRQNALKLQGAALARQLETAEAAHARRLSQYNVLLKEGVISQELFNKARAHSFTTMRQQSSMGGRGMGQAAFQAGYGIQDFATVLAMGGSPGMAIMSAQNNLSQMLMVATKLNPLMVSLGGTVAALAAIGIGLWWDEYNKGASTAERATESVAKEMERLKAAMAKRDSDIADATSVNRLIDRAPLDEMHDARLSRVDAIEDGQSALKRNIDEERRIRNAVITDPMVRAAAEEARKAAFHKSISASTNAEGQFTEEDVRRADRLGQQAFDSHISELLKSNEQMKDNANRRIGIQDKIARDEQAIASLTEEIRRAAEIESKISDARLQQEQRAAARQSGESVLKSLEANRRAQSVAKGLSADFTHQQRDEFERFFGDVAQADLTPEQRKAMLAEFTDNQRAVAAHRMEQQFINPNRRAGLIARHLATPSQFQDEDALRAFSAELPGHTNDPAERKKLLDEFVANQRAVAERRMMDTFIKPNQRAGMIANRMAVPEQFQMEDALRNFATELRNFPGAAAEKGKQIDEFAGNQRAELRREIFDLTKQNKKPIEASFESFSGFGQSLQMQLLKPQDEAKKQREKQITLLTKADTALQQIASQTKQNIAVAAP